MIEVDAVIVGGGFSGAAVAAQLARRTPPDFSLALFEPNELGRGAAYGTRHDEHVLNTRAAMMSLFPDDCGHFVRWLGPRANPQSFVSRRLYGAYVNEIARQAFERSRFTHVADRVRRIERRGHREYVVESGIGTRFVARAVVLATGNPLPNGAFLPHEIRLHPGYIDDPWHCDYRRVGGHVLAIGSGLTTLDVLVALDACGHRGVVHVLSRRGRFPNVHADVAPYDVIPALDTRDARALLRSFRLHVRKAAERGFDWRSVVDAIRPEAEAIWRRLSPAERRRFERHLRTHWERHRHRAPQQVDAVRRRYHDANRLVVYAGTIAHVQRATVTIVLRNGERADVRPDWIVNCTGVGGAPAMRRDPMLAGMFTDGLICAAPGNLGLLTTSALGAVGPTNVPVDGLWVVGPPVRGSRFEATAVPELRVMAELVAREIARTSSGLIQPSLGTYS
ncbi:MAG TPA: FAD/NAD(P)-binding protein [Candidatus Cybelea sp.]|nr:FAD/NAD(P)-binding protein [Candidatus Cybelea sp.]